MLSKLITRFIIFSLEIQRKKKEKESEKQGEKSGKISRSPPPQNTPEPGS